MNNHYYLLPDGTEVDNMKDGCEALNISSEKFRAKVKTGEVVKVTNRANASKDEYKV